MGFKMEKYIDQNGNVWVTGEIFTFGPYSKAGAIAKANIEKVLSLPEITFLEVRKYELCDSSIRFFGDDIFHFLEVEADAVYATCSYEDRVFIREGEKTKDIISALEEYPILDEDSLSEVEAEMEENAFWDGVVFDLLSYGSKNFYNFFCTRIGEYKEIIWEAYKEAMDTTNTYPLPEYDTVYIDCARIANVFIDAVIKLFSIHRRDRWKNKAYKKNMLYLPGTEQYFK